MKKKLEHLPALQLLGLQRERGLVGGKCVCMCVCVGVYMCGGRSDASSVEGP